MVNVGDAGAVRRGDAFVAQYRAVLGQHPLRTDAVRGQRHPLELARLVGEADQPLSAGHERDVPVADARFYGRTHEPTALDGGDEHPAASSDDDAFTLCVEMRRGQVLHRIHPPLT